MKVSGVDVVSIITPELSSSKSVKVVEIKSSSKAGLASFLSIVQNIYVSATIVNVIKVEFSKMRNTNKLVFWHGMLWLTQKPILWKKSVVYISLYGHEFAKRSLKLAENEMIVFTLSFRELWRTLVFRIDIFLQTLTQLAFLHGIWLTSKVSTTDTRNIIEEGQDYCTMERKSAIPDQKNTPLQHREFHWKKKW